MLERALRLPFFQQCLGAKAFGARPFVRSLKCTLEYRRLLACSNIVQAKVLLAVLNCVGSQHLAT